MKSNRPGIRLLNVVSARTAPGRSPSCWARRFRLVVLERFGAQVRADGWQHQMAWQIDQIEHVEEILAARYHPLHGRLVRRQGRTEEQELSSPKDWDGGGEYKTASSRRPGVRSKVGGLCLEGDSARGRERRSAEGEQDRRPETRSELGHLFMPSSYAILHWLERQVECEGFTVPFTGAPV